MDSLLYLVVPAVAIAAVVALSLTDKEKNKDNVEVWKGDNKLWYWHRQASNNEIISNSEGYKTKQGAIKGAFRANSDIDEVHVKENDSSWTNVSR